MLTSLYLFGKKENGTWGKDVLSNIIDDPTDLIAAIEEFTSNKKEDTKSAIVGFVDKENDNWELCFWWNSCFFVMFLERFAWYEDVEEMNIYAWVSYSCFVPCLLWTLHVEYQHPWHENPQRYICQANSCSITNCFTNKTMVTDCSNGISFNKI